MVQNTAIASVLERTETCDISYTQTTECGGFTISMIWSDGLTSTNNTNYLTNYSIFLCKQSLVFLALLFLANRCYIRLPMPLTFPYRQQREAHYYRKPSLGYVETAIITARVIYNYYAGTNGY